MYNNLIKIIKMKKTYFVIVIIALLFSCSKKEEMDLSSFVNPHELVRDEEYDKVQLGSNIYTDNFTSASTSSWGQGENNNYRAYFDNDGNYGHYILEPKTNLRLHSDDFSIDNNKDFQIEISYAFLTIINNHPYPGGHGFGFGNSAEDFYFMSLVAVNYQVGLQIGFFNSATNTYDVLHKGDYSYDKKYEYFTIRKIGNKIQFFFNHHFQYETDNEISFSRFVFILPVQSVLSVNSVSIDYLVTK
jgi:hypothetical protein